MYFTTELDFTDISLEKLHMFEVPPNQGSKTIRLDKKW